MMATQSRRDRLEVRSDSSTPSVTPPTAEAGAQSEGEKTPYVEPEEYGVRTSWQSEAVRIEAAEFLLATRVQEERQWRLSRMIERLRLQRKAERGE